MVILDPEKVSQFLLEISRGFAVTRSELLIFILLLAGIVVFLLLFAILQGRKSRRDMSRRSAEIFHRLAGRFDLNTEEWDTLKQMEAFLKKGEPEYALLLRPHLFDACARQLAAAGEVHEQILSALRLKLGFPARGPEEIPASSSELVLGKKLLVFSPDHHSFPAVIQAQTPAALVVSSERDGQGLQNGAPVTVYFHSPVGVFSFPSRMMRREGGRLYLRHSGKLQRYQRRRFYRRRFRAPVRLRPAGSRLDSVDSVLLDLGGGGASLINPGGRFKAADRLELSFPPVAGGSQVIGRVLRTSRGEAVLHLAFEKISESSRDRILGSILSRKGLQGTKGMKKNRPEPERQALA
jgi:hypothetical protein